MSAALVRLFLTGLPCAEGGKHGCAQRPQELPQEQLQGLLAWRTGAPALRGRDPCAHRNVCLGEPLEAKSKHGRAQVKSGQHSAIGIQRWHTATWQCQRR